MSNQKLIVFTASWIDVVDLEIQARRIISSASTDPLTFVVVHCGEEKLTTTEQYTLNNNICIADKDNVVAMVIKYEIDSLPCVIVVDDNDVRVEGPEPIPASLQQEGGDRFALAIESYNSFDLQNAAKW